MGPEGLRGSAPGRRPFISNALVTLDLPPPPVRGGGTFSAGDSHGWRRRMTPDKRATLLTAFKWIVASALLLGGAITAAQWLMAVAA